MAELIGYALAGLALFYFLSAICTNPDKKINLNDINVGDILKIKGEEFIVNEYSPDGIMELISKKDDKTYYLKLDEKMYLVYLMCDGKRKHIELRGFEGTVGGQYLNKIKP